MYRLQNRPIELAGITAEVNTDAFDIRSQWGFAIALQWTHTAATGAIKAQASNDAALWFDISGATADPAAVLNAFFNEQQTFYKFVRVQLDITAGTVDTFKMVFNSKG